MTEDLNVDIDLRCGMPVYNGTSNGQVLQMRYIIERELSSDFMGVKYLAEDTQDKKDVIIWALPIAESGDEEKIECISRLYNSLKKLADENYINMSDLYSEKNVLYFVMEYVDWCLIEAIIRVKESDRINYEKLLADIIQEHQQQNGRYEETIKNLTYAEIQKQEHINILDQALSQATQQANNQCFDYERTITHLRADVETLKSEFAVALSQSQQDIEILEQQKQEALNLNKELTITLEKFKEDFKQQYIKFKSQLADLEQKADAEKQTREKAEENYLVLEKEIGAINAQVAEQNDNFSANLYEIQQQLETQINATAKAEGQQIIYENTIEQLKIQVAQGENRLNSTLKQTDKEIETLVAEKQELLQKNKENEENLEKLKTQAEQQINNLTELLNQTQQEIDKKDKSLIKIKKTETKPTFKFKISAVAVFVLVVGIICGIVVSNLYATIKKQDTSSVRTDNALPATKQEVSESPQWQKSALEFEQKGDFANAAQLYLKAANDGDSNGMYKLGYAYITGIGLEKNVDKAIYLLKKASEKGNDDAMLELGRIYYTGQDVDKDCNKAFEFFTEAATSGNELAMYNTARMYHQGMAVEVNIPKAIEWYEKAAQHGLTRAMNQLGQIYSSGGGGIVEQDFSKSKMYYELSAKQADPSGMYNLAVLYYNGIGVEKDIRQAARWFSKAAEKGDPDAMYQLGLMYENGTNIKKDLGVAIYWYKTAAKAGNETAKKHLEELSKSDN
jgi:TPR repeat protein